MADNKLYEVEKILGKKLLPSKRVLYLVRWKGFSSDHDSWEPYSNLDACKPLISLYNKSADEQHTSSPSLKKAASQSKTGAGENGPVIKESPKRKSAGKNLAEILSKAKGSPHKKKEDKKTDSPGQQARKSKPPSGAETKVTKPKAKHEEGRAVSSEESSKSLDSSKTSSDKDVVHAGGDGSKSAKQKAQKRKLEKEDADKKNSNTSGPSKPKKLKVSADEKDEVISIKDSDDVTSDEITSDEAGNDADDDDDDILYSLNPNCDILDHDDDDERKSKENAREKKKSVKVKKNKDGTVPVKQNPKSANSDESSGKNAGKKKKRMSLMDSKKQSKDWLTKSGLFRSVSPPPLFTSVKHLMGSPDTQNPSKPSGNSLPDPVSPEASETYLADVPSSYPVPAEEPHANEQPLSPGSLSYKSLLDSLPDQLHPSHKGSKKGKGDNSNGDSSSTGSISLLGASVASSLGREPVERRTSVRSTECAFRYKQIVVKKCFRYTQIWLNTQTVMKNALNPQVIQEVVSALNSAKYDDSHLVLFSSLGNVFCSGTDLHFLVSGDRKMAARQMADAIRDLTKTFITFPKPIIAAVSGAAVGLGVSLLALCDVVYASDKASFHLPYSQLSQTPEGCSSFTLPLTLGLPSANELLYGGRKITAMEAYQLGLVSQVFWPTLMMQEVIPRAQNMAACSAKALEATKLLVRSHHRTKMELTNETECNLLLERWLSVDCQRAIEAYLSNEKNLTF